MVEGSVLFPEPGVEKCRLMFYPEDGGSMVVGNAGAFPPDYTVLYPTVVRTPNPTASNS
jgi:hypothetical protein